MKKRSNIKKLTVTGILGAIAFVLMLLSFTIVGQYKLDFSEIAVLIGAFTYGPLVGIAIEGIKILLDIILGGPSDTAYVGEAANFLIGLAFIVPSSFIYFRNKTKKQAVIGLAVGIFFMVVVAVIMNAFVLLPLYARLYFGYSLDDLLAFYGFDNLFSFLIIATVPFNLLKGFSSSIIVLVIYKRISILLKAKDCEGFEECN